MMDMMKMNDAAKRLSDKLGIAGWVSVALSVILFSFGLWTLFHSVGGPLTAAYRDDTVYVQTSYGKEAKLPSDTKLMASLVTPEDDPNAYAQEMAAALAAMGRDGETAQTNAIYHVGFYSGDQEVEPAAPVNVNIQVQDGFAIGQPIQVIHLRENDTKVIADTLVDDAGFVSFTTDSFSDFVFVQTGEDEDGEQDGDAPDMEETSGTEGTSSMEGNGIVGSGIVDSGRSWMGITMMDGEIDGPTFDGAISPIANGPDRSINLNDLTEDEVSLTFQYMEDGTWHNVPDGKNIFDYYNSDISINFQFNKDFTQEELTNANGKLTYDLPPYLKDFGTGVSGELKDQNGKVAGTVTVDGNGKVTIQLTDDFIKNNSTAKNLHFSLSGHVDLNKATDKEVGDQNYPGFNLKIPTDEREAHSQYGTLKLEKACKSLAPYRDPDTGEWYLDYDLTVTAPDFDMPDVRVEDVFDLSGSGNADVKARLQDLIEEYVLYSVDNEASMSHEVGKTTPDLLVDNSVYQTNGEDSVPHLNWYLGDMKKGETRTLHYRVRLDKEKMEQTDFTKDGTILPNDAEAYSQNYPKDDAHDELPIKMHVNINKAPQGKFESDGKGGGWLTFKVWVKNESQYPVNVKVYDSVNEPHANTTNNKKANKGEGMTYEDFTFTDSTGKPLEPQPEVDFSVKGEDGAKYTSFTAHLGWMEPEDEVYIVYKIHVDAKTLAAGPVDVNNGVLALFEDQEASDESYLTWLERYQQNHTIDQKQWAEKSDGGAVPAETSVAVGPGGVYDATGDAVTKMENPDLSFTLGEHSFKYTVTVDGNTIWDVSSATMGDKLTNGLHYSGYVQVVAKGQDGTVLGTAWVKVDGLKNFSFKGDDIGFGDYGAGTSYELTYYTTVDEDNRNVYFVRGNDFSLEGEVYGPGDTVINVSVKDSTSSTAQTANHREVTKDAWYYETDAQNLGAFYWVVKVDANYIPNGFALKDMTGVDHELRDDSLLGVYTGPAYTFDETLKWGAFQADPGSYGFKSFDQYTREFEAGKGWTVKFDKGDYTPDPGQYVYLFFKTYVTARQTDPYENKVYSNDGTIPDTTKVEHLEDDAASYLPGVGGVEKAGMQVFDWDGVNIDLLRETKNPTDYQLDAAILKNANVHTGRYAAWSVSVNKKGGMEGDFTITDQIPDGMELSFVAIAKTVNILQPNTNNTPPWAIPLSGMGEGESGLLVGHAKTNPDAYTTGSTYKSKWDKKDEWKPWTAENWKYYPSTDRTVSWGVHIEHSMCISNQTNKPLSAYEVDYLVVCRVTDPDVLLGVTTGDPQKAFNNHVTVYQGDKTVANADAEQIVPCNPVVTKSGDQIIEGGHPQQNIKFTLKVNEDATMVESNIEGEDMKTLTLKDQMSKNLVLNLDTVKFYRDPECTVSLEGCTFSLLDNVITFTIPNGTAVYIQYECLINAPAGTTEGTPVENTVYFDKRVPGEKDTTWEETVTYDPAGGISGSKTMQITKKDSLTGVALPGAEFEVKLLGTTDENGSFTKSEDVPENHHTLTTGDNGVSDSFGPVEGGLYEIRETKAPEGYVPDETARYYYWVGGGNHKPPTTPEAAGLSEGTTITPMYTGVINVEITNERARINVTKEFVNADGNSIDDVTGTYWFGLFKKEGDTYVEAPTAYGPWKQSLTYPVPAGEDGVLTFYVPYTKEGELETQYYILELGEDDKPMESGSRTWAQSDVMGTIEVEPSYDYGELGKDAASSADAETEVTVTNTCYSTYRLPESGGPGTLIYLLAGLVLMAGSGAMLFAGRRMRREK